MDNLIDYSGIYPNFTSNNTSSSNNNNYIELMFYSAYYWKTMYLELLQKYENLLDQNNSLTYNNELSKKSLDYNDCSDNNMILSQLQSKNTKLIQTIMEKNMELSQLYKFIDKQKIPISPPLLPKPPHMIDLCMNPIYNTPKIFSIDPSQPEKIVMPQNPPIVMRQPPVIHTEILYNNHVNHIERGERGRQGGHGGRGGHGGHGGRGGHGGHGNHYSHNNYFGYNDFYYPRHRYPYSCGYFPCNTPYYPPYYLRDIENPITEENE